MSPTSRLLVLLLGPLALALLAVPYPALARLVWAANALVLGIALADLITLPRRRWLRLERRGSANLSVGTPNTFHLHLQNRSRLPLRLQLTESPPAEMTLLGLPLRLSLPARGQAALRYQLTPRRRGAFSLGRTYIAAASQLGLWQRQLRLTLPGGALKVFPNVKQLNTYTLLARRHRIDLLGFRKTRGRGSDVEFDRLRDYQPDDDYRRIDSHASARYRRLITREYEVSRNQNIFFMVDCSRLMAARSAGLSNLDHALNATLMLSYLALEMGDNVGLLAFDEAIRTFLPFSSGVRSKTALLHALYDLHAAPAEPDYEQALLTLHRRVRQRSLVVLLTNLSDRASFELLLPHLRLLGRRHLPLVLLLRDADLFELAERPPENVQGFYELGAAAELASWRERMARDLQQLGALVLDLVPAQTTPELINSYLRIKADQLL